MLDEAVNLQGCSWPLLPVFSSTYFIQLMNIFNDY